MTDTGVLNGVPETLLVPLFYRAKETRSDTPLIRDDKAVEIVDAINYDFSMCNKWLTQACVVVRTQIFQDAIRQFLEANPEAVVINLAAGLDNRFAELDNGKVLWFDLDLPDVIEIRKCYIKETGRRKFIASDVLAFDWIDSLRLVDRNVPVLVIAEGLLPYLPEDRARLLLSTLADNFLNSRIILEIFGSVVVGREWMVSEFKHIKPRPEFLWSPHNPRTLETWDSRFKILKVENLFDRHPARWRSMRYLFKSETIKNMLGSRCISLQLNAS
jgi:O-methyltransferase involved in polyketide biosynthesis